MIDHTALVLGFLGRGPATRMACVACLLGRGLSYAEAEIATGRAILDLIKVGKIESCGPDVFRLSASTPMEAEKNSSDRQLSTPINARKR